jgi:3-oxoacyl-[acyl-carrier protein] reductase
MDLGLTDKVAWVHGASSGLGRATALALAREGAAVACSARSLESLEEAAADIESETGAHCVAVPLDVSDAHSIGPAHEQVVNYLGPVDILLSNAGGPPPGTFETLGEDELHHAFSLTAASAWRLTKVVLPGMSQKGKGCILYLTSSSTKEVIPNLLLSNMMRASVVGMAKTLSKELGSRGIRVLCVAPGRIETARLQALDQGNAERSGRPAEEIAAEAKARIPLGRYGDPQEFGDVVAFLASERAAYVSGITVTIDGGMLNGVLS